MSETGGNVATTACQQNAMTLSSNTVWKLVSNMEPVISD